ncbi:heterokaryon incompatibility, partial [Hyaloscypha variabilis F]
MGGFEALSYTWGEENLDGRVMVDGKLCYIHKNREAALRRLQYGMRYWIDALCINQADVQERNTEVKRMRNLYEKAWSVVVWLGEECEESLLACDFISSICHLTYFMNGHCYIHYPEEFYREKKWKPLMDILTRSYWTRLWIIQELTM